MLESPSDSMHFDGQKNRRFAWPFARLRADISGASLILTALMLPILVGVVGLSVDASIWEMNKRDLQGAADQAAYSAARAAGQTGATSALAITQGKAVMASMGFVDGTDGVVVQINNAPTQGSFAGNSRGWEVIATKTQNLYFLGLFLQSGPTISVRAVALKQTVAVTTPAIPGTTIYSTPGCILSLDPSGAGATTINNNGTVQTTTCAIYTNSNNASALKCNDNCLVTADTYTVGGRNTTGGQLKGTNTTVSTTTSNPFSSLTTPNTSSMTCVNNSGAITATSSSVSITPGYYCKGINFSGSGKTLTMAAGTYYVSSIFNISGGATLDATASAGVTIVIVGNYCIGNTNVNCDHPDEGVGGGGSHINIKAPTTGTYAGVAMFFTGSQTANFSGSNRTIMHNFANTSYTSIDGALYAPNQTLQFNNNSAFDSAKCTQLVGYRVWINNNGGYGPFCSSGGTKKIQRVLSTTPDTPGTTIGTNSPSQMVE